jgi:hypothetical protein
LTEEQRQYLQDKHKGSSSSDVRYTRGWNTIVLPLMGNNLTPTWDAFVPGYYREKQCRDIPSKLLAQVNGDKQFSPKKEDESPKKLILASKADTYKSIYKVSMLILIISKLAVQ